MKIKINHLCPSCRIVRKEWDVPDIQINLKRPVRRGQLLTYKIFQSSEDIESLNNTQAFDQCDACGEAFSGVVICEYDEASQTMRLIDVRGPIS